MCHGLLDRLALITEILGINDILGSKVKVLHEKSIQHIKMDIIINHLTYKW